MKRYIVPAILAVIILSFFWKYFLYGSVPVPADALVGLYHPFRDTISSEYPNGIAYKNFLITDPIRQQYPWRYLSIKSLKNGEIPTWNQFSFSGYPLMANLQSAPLYPLNVLFFILPFASAWSILVILQPLLSSLFMYMFLKNKKLSNEASIFGGLIFALSGVSIAWLEWNTIGHVILWLPLILLGIDRIINRDNTPMWISIVSFSLISSFFAGHAQVFFYIFLVSVSYAVVSLKGVSRSNQKKVAVSLLISFIVFLLISSVQWVPFVQFISYSARDIDQGVWQRQGWFVPFVHLIQFIAPDFFGNPTTQNYWGIWNYAEFIGYIGIFPLVFSFTAIFFVKNRLVIFMSLLVVTALVFATDNLIARLPFQLSIPFISSSQPTRMLAIVDFGLAVLAAIGLNEFIKKTIDIKKISIVIGIVSILFASVWLSVLLRIVPSEYIVVASRNLIMPSLLFTFAIGIFYLYYVLIKIKSASKFLILIPLVIISITVGDLFRFGWKFTPFVQADYLYPESSALSYLNRQKGVFRIMTTDDRILPPNVSSMYGIQTVEGYDPLYLSDYGEFVTSWVRNKPDISPFSFNRLVTPHDIKHPFTNLLNVKYILSFDSIKDTGYEKVYQEGKTLVYRNNNALPRAYFAEEIIVADNKQEAINALYQDHVSDKIAVIYKSVDVDLTPTDQYGSVEILEYLANKIVIQTKSNADRFLVLSDVYYPTWNAFIDAKMTTIYKTNYAFRGVIVPSGKHTVTFENKLW